ncbi:hypothetical protein B0J13DRAFT_554028 [Dactylonectria estremocensis]|uniref:Uncharacterized protein n=1 Tax=Dactylonectria estremocensis TaxID=1079267 RepID=A0A9P9EV02_9HYPO|nr:hypothetical protein B0J13DRAFT_554028 [Dactylonectria estremocensis]
MAQGRVVRGYPNGQSAPLRLAENQSREAQQYERIARFEEAILSGNHPTIKVPAHLIASARSSTHPIDGAIKSDARTHQLGNSLSFAANAQQPSVPAGATQPCVDSATSAAKPFLTGNTEINPILLEKSDDLIKAELQLQRQRLERALRDDVDQRRAATKNTSQGEPVAELDLSDILSKALTLVQASSAPVPADENVAATNHDTSSDSFDDNTFYSSQHNTPESVLVSHVRNESEGTRVPVANESQKASGLHNDSARHNPPTGAEPESNASQSYRHHPRPTVNDSSSRVGQVPGLNSHIDESVVPHGPNQINSTGQSRSDDSGNAEADQHEVIYRAVPRQHLSNSYHDNLPPSPLMRRHEQSPPTQIVHISPLTAARRPAPLTEHVSISSTGTPAQIIALRTEPAAVTSPESSPQGGKASDGKKGKKKKRKAERQAPEAETTPYIKPEPRSPSPMNAPSYIRPNKRQRYSQRPANEPGSEATQTSSAPYETYPGRLQRDDRIPVGYERTTVYSHRAASAAGAGPVYAREYADDRYMSGGPYFVAPPLVPASHPDHHQTQLSSQMRASEGYPRSSWPYQGAYDQPPMSARPESEAFIAPPRQPPTRIVVDAFGREYIEPPRPTVVRHSVAPPVRAGDPEIIYERTAPRAVSRHTGVESYEQGGPIYRRTSPPYMPRRVITQPEYISQDYRDSRQQDYSTRPMAPSNEFVEVMAPPERRHMEEGPREFITRSASVRPAEPVRYEVSREYGRVQSVRPEGQVRQYATSAHSEGRREAAQPYMVRDYDPRPMEAAMVRQEYGVRPVERFYDHTMRGGEDIAFIERPRGATQEIVYADDVRREVYR